MGSAFGGGKSGGWNITPQQQHLLKPIADYLTSMIGSPNQGLIDVDAILGGNSEFTKNMGSNLFRDALLTPSLREFDRVTRPAIESGFAKLGSTLSSRRGQAIADGYKDIHAGAQAQVAAALPGLVQLQLGAIGQREQLRFLPTQMGVDFATRGTVGVNSQSYGNVGGQILGAVGTGVGAYAALASDERVKKDIKPIKNATAKLSKLKGVEFEYNDAKYGTGKRIGVLAQNVEKVFPELVLEDELSGVKMVRTHGMEGAFIESTKELDSRVRALEEALGVKS